MKKMTSQNNEVRRLCQQINHEVNSEKLQSLALRLQQVLREERSPTHFERGQPGSRRQDNPFDKVLVC